MKILHFFRLFFFMIIVTFFSKCTKVLDLEPISQISTASFWKTEDDARGALVGMYVRMRDQFATNYFLWGEGRSDVMGIGAGGTQGNSIYYQNQLIPTNAGPTWQGLYTIIHDANLIIKYVPAINFSSETKKNNTLAQAYAMRAFIYFIIAKTWGDAILIQEPMEGFNAESIQRERSPVSEVFALIKSDLGKATELFATMDFVDGRSMWSKPAVYALTADVYLWTAKTMNGGNADLTTALSALESIEQSDVALLDNFADIFKYDNKGNKEILMSVNYKENESGANLYEYMYISAATLPGTVSQATRDYIGAFKYDAWSISQLARNQFSPQDLRRNVSFYDIYTVSGATTTYFGSIVTKFRGIVVGGTRLFLDDIILYRYADVLLMKAEAKNALGQDPSTEINLVRQRAYKTNFEDFRFVNGSKESNDAAILKERLFELIFEGKRWWDLVRFDKAFEIVPSLQNRAGDRYLLLFPISETTLSLESKVEQNEGY